VELGCAHPAPITNTPPTPKMPQPLGINGLNSELLGELQAAHDLFQSIMVPRTTHPALCSPCAPASQHYYLPTPLREALHVTVVVAAVVVAVW